MMLTPWGVRHNQTPVYRTITVSGVGTFGGILTVSATPSTNSDARYNIISSDPTAFAAGVGGGIVFRAKYNTAGTSFDAGSVKGIKENATDGNFAGALVFTTHPDGGSPTERLRITSDGRLYGTALHNNAGAVTGTTNQYIASGTYTPTISNTVNIDSSSGAVTQWIRVGNVAHVSGVATIDPTSSSSATSFDLTLPIASTLTAVSSLNGVGAYQGSSIVPVVITKNGGNDKANLAFVAPSNTSATLYFTFSYLIA